MRPEDFVRELDARPGSVRGRQSAPPTSKEIFAERMQAASDANQVALAYRSDVIRRKLEEVRNRVQAEASLEAPAEAPLETQNESEET